MDRFNVTSAKIQMGLSGEKSLLVAMLPQRSLGGINKGWMRVLTSALSFQADETAEDFRSNEVTRTKKYNRQWQWMRDNPPTRFWTMGGKGKHDLKKKKQIPKN